MYFNATSGAVYLVLGNSVGAVSSGKLFATTVNSTIRLEIPSDSASLSGDVCPAVTTTTPPPIFAAPISETGEVALASVGSSGAQIGFYSPGALSPIVISRSNFTIRGGASVGVPFSLVFSTKSSADSLFFAAVVFAAKRSYPVPVLALRNSPAEEFSFRYLGDQTSCSQPTELSGFYTAISDDRRLAVVVQPISLLSFRPYLVDLSRPGELIPLAVGVSPLYWNATDMIPGTLPVLFGPNFLEIAARLAANVQAIYRFNLTSGGVVYESSPQVLNDAGDIVFLANTVRSRGPALFVYDRAGGSIIRRSPAGNSAAGFACNSCPLVAVGPGIVGYGKTGSTIVLRSVNAVGAVKYINFNSSDSGLVVADAAQQQSPHAFVLLRRELVVMQYRYKVSLWNPDVSTNTSAADAGPTAFLSLSSSGTLCGCWQGGAVILLSNDAGGTRVLVWEFSNTTLRTVYTTSVSYPICKKVSSSIFLFQHQYEMGYFLAKSATFRVVPQSALVPGQQFYLGSYDLVGSSTGLQVVTNIQDSVARPAAIVFVKLFELDLCESAADCAAGNYCEDNRCTLLSNSPVSCPGAPPVAGARCIGGVWIIDGDVQVNGTVLVTAPTRINGSLVLFPNATILLSGGATLDVSDCASFAGALNMNRPAPTDSQVNASIVVISFSGFCGGVPSSFNSSTLTFTGQDACVKRESEPALSYTQRSVSVLFTFDRSGCGTDSERTLSAGAIAGIAIGAVAFVAIIIAIVLVVKFKSKILPFSSRTRETSQQVEELES